MFVVLGAGHLDHPSPFALSVRDVLVIPCEGRAGGGEGGGRGVSLSAAASCIRGDHAAAAASRAPRVVGWVVSPAASLSRSGRRAAGAWSPARLRARAAGQREQLRQHRHRPLVRHPLPVSQQPQRRPHQGVWRCGAGRAGGSSMGVFGSFLGLSASGLSASNASTPLACLRWPRVAAACWQRAAAAAHSRGRESCALMVSAGRV